MERLPSLIGVCGPMGAGKDTLAALIAAHYPAFRQWKFADALRAATAIVSGVDASKTLSAEDKAFDLSPIVYSARQLRKRLADAIDLTIRGTSYAGAPSLPLAEKMFAVLTGAPYKEEAGDYAVSLKMTVGRLLQLLGTEGFRQHVGPNVWVESLVARWESERRPSIVVADVRFQNEADAIRRRGGIVVKVHRKDASRTDGRSTAHASEREISDILPDIAVGNDGTIEELRTLVDTLWRSVAALAELRQNGAIVTMELRASSFPDTPEGREERQLALLQATTASPARQLGEQRGAGSGPQ